MINRPYGRRAIIDEGEQMGKSGKKSQDARKQASGDKKPKTEGDYILRHRTSRGLSGFPDMNAFGSAANRRRQPGAAT